MRDAYCKLVDATQEVLAEPAANEQERSTRIKEAFAAAGYSEMLGQLHELIMMAPDEGKKAKQAKR